MHKKKQSKIVAFAAPKDTILARLKTAMKKENTTNNLIKFLHMENAAVLTFQVSEKNEIMKKHAEEYAEFYRYFWGSFFNEVVAEAIYKEWGELPQIFRFANACCEYHDEIKLREYKNQLSREELAEADSLCKRIFDILMWSHSCPILHHVLILQFLVRKKK